MNSLYNNISKKSFKKVIVVENDKMELLYELEQVKTCKKLYEDSYYRATTEEFMDALNKVRILSSRISEIENAINLYNKEFPIEINNIDNNENTINLNDYFKLVIPIDNSFKIEGIYRLVLEIENPETDIKVTSIIGSSILNKKINTSIPTPFNFTIMIKEKENNLVLIKKKVD